MTTVLTTVSSHIHICDIKTSPKFNFIQVIIYLMLFYLLSHPLMFRVTHTNSQYTYGHTPISWSHIKLKMIKYKYYTSYTKTCIDNLTNDSAPEIPFALACITILKVHWPKFYRLTHFIPLFSFCTSECKNNTNTLPYMTILRLDSYPLK